MEPQRDFFHIAGRSAREYLSENLVQFISATQNYFDLGDKFRDPYVAPTSGVTTDRAQKLQLRIVPMQTEETDSYYKARYTLNVGDNRIVDLSSAYFDIKGTIDRGPSFKPYSGTAYNPLAPKSAIVNSQLTAGNGKFTVGQLPNVYQAAGNGIPEAQAQPSSNVLPNPQTGEANYRGIHNINPENEGAAGRAIKYQDNQTAFPCYGSYAAPQSAAGDVSTANVEKAYFNTTTTATRINAVCTLDTIDWRSPDAHYLNYEGDHKCTSAGDRANYIGFRDNFIGLMYYNNGSNSGSFGSQTQQLNMVQDLTDRNSELSYQYMLADLTNRYAYFSLWNQAVDDYDPSVRIISNEGYEEGPAALSFPTEPISTGFAGPFPAKGATINGEQGENLPNNTGVFGFGDIPCLEMNLALNLQRTFLYSNVAMYLPDQYKYTTKGVANVAANQQSYQYMNARIPIPNVIDSWTNIGARWSLDIMDNVNPFNHHRNNGLKYRSQLLGNGRFVNFHIQVPQKFFAIKNLLLLPGTYNYEWYFRRDPNMILQSTLGNDLRADGAVVTFDQINLYVSYFPLAYDTQGELELMLRNATNDQNFSDYMGAVNNLYQIPPNSSTVVVNVPDRSWGCFRGWSFNRVKASETPRVGATKDPNFTYSGSIPYLDGTFYLGHTFQRLSIQWDSSVPWPGNDRLLTPNWLEIKRSPEQDAEGYTTSQSTLTKDFFLIQMASNYNQGYQGYHWPSTTKHYGFINNFEPMTRQVPVFGPDTFDLYSEFLKDPTKMPIWNNAGFQQQPADSSLLEAQGHPYVANWPYPLTGAEAVEQRTQRKFLIDKYMWRVPFSSNFLNMGTLTDLGQNVLYANTGHSLNMQFTVDPMPELTYLMLLFGVFDQVVINQPTRSGISVAYLRLPFSAGSSAS